MTQSSDLRLVFLASQKFESGKVVRGAFLLTDSNTRPLEFRCTNPIRPTALQTVLYGDVLQQHIMVELIGLPLLNTLKQHADLVLVRESDLLNIRPKIEIPLIQVAKEETIPISSSTDESSAKLLRCESGRFEPIVLIAHSKFSSDRDQAKAVLADVFNSSDLLEPFNRIAIALEQVHAQKIGEEK